MRYPICDSSPKVKFILASLFFLFFAFLAQWPICHLNGWPMNHDGILLFERVGVFYQEMKKGNFFPMWTSYGQNGYGSAFPFLYHRFFNSIAALLSFPTGSVYQAVKLSLVGLLCFGALGMFYLVRQAGLSLLYSLCAGVLFIFANYTYTDWLIRGAVAELTAMVFIPWLFYSCVLLVQNKKYASLKIGIVLSCLFYSHIVIFYYALLVCLIFYSAFFFHNKKFCSKRTYFEVASQLSILVLLCGIYALGIILFKRMYNFSALTVDGNDPAHNFPMFEKYLLHRGYHWGNDWQGLSVEIGRVFNLASIFFTLAALFLLVRKKIDFNKMKIKLGLYFIFLICIFVFLALQIPLFKFFYAYVPGANFIQFPWRLLSFSTVLSIVALCFSIHILECAEGVQKRDKWFKITLVLITLYQVSFGLTIPIHYKVMSQNFISGKMKPENLLFSGEPPEYRPKNGLLPFASSSLVEVVGKDCQVLGVAPEEALHKVTDADRVSLHIKGHCNIFYNQFVNPFTDISFSDRGEIQRTNRGTYLFISNTNQVQIIEIKRVGLVQAIYKYLTSRNRKMYE